MVREALLMQELFVVDNLVLDHVFGHADILALWFIVAIARRRKGGNAPRVILA